MGLKSGSKSGKGVKQTATKLSTSKSSPESHSKPTNSDDDDDDIDTSVMRPSIEISVSTVPQLVRAYQAATEELKSILARECDIIYECRVCRNLFRSLANMMAHKRVYCRTTYSYSKHTINRNHMMEDYTVLIQPEPVPSTSEDTQNWTTSDKVPDCSIKNDNAKSQIAATTSRISSLTNTKKGLCEIVDRLARNTLDSGKETKYTSASKLNDIVDTSILAHKNDRMEHSFQLEDIETSKVGKFQTKLVSGVGAEKDDLMKAQVSELQHMASQNEAILGPDGRMIVLNRPTSISVQKCSSGKISDSCIEASEHKVTKEEHVCPDCNVKFSTRKTLNHHMKSLHVTFRICYPCPCCKSTFVNPWSVYRHLYKVHRKTAAQVRRLRPQIQKKAFKKEIHNESPAPEISAKNDALKESQRLDLENQAWMDNFEDDLELQRCGGCGRRFERRAALNSHSQICQKRIAARNNIKTIRSVPSTSSPEKVSKVSQAEERNVTAMDINKKSINLNKRVDSVNNLLNTLSSSRTLQGSTWVEQPKKAKPEKKIEIQIRKDYCKMSSASSVVALSNDTQSEADSRPPSCTVEDADSFVDEREWDMIDMEDVAKEESDMDYRLFRDPEDSNVLANEGDKDEDTSCSNSPTEDSGSSAELNQPVRNNVLDTYQRSKNDFCMYRRPANVLKRRISDETEYLSSNLEKETIKRRRQSSDSENYDIVKDSKPTSSKTKKLEQFHPVMEARMKKLINLRRLQCLPCQKKFIKLTNLRRHVAVHIGWCRYKCVLCSFKCFSKYDCVDHVCKIHLKGAQRTKAATMVEYINEQESEAAVTTIELEESNDGCEILSNGEEVPESLAVEINSLNIEDIKNIVGVACYPANANKSAESNASEGNIDNPSSTQQSSEDILAMSDSENDVYILDDVSNQRINSQNHLEEENTTVCGKEDSAKSLEQIDKVQNGNMQTEMTMNVCENADDIQTTENLLESAEGENNPERLDTALTVESNKEDTSGCEVSAEDEPKPSTNSDNEENKAEHSSKSFNVPLEKGETKSVSPYLIYDDQKSDISELSMEEELVGSVRSFEDISDKNCEPAESFLQLQTSEVDCVQEMIMKNVQELDIPNTPLENAISEDTNTDESIGDSTCAENSKSEEEGEGRAEEEEENSQGDKMDSLKNPLNPERDENALRKMVMEVIFGSGGASGLHSDPNKNLISVSMNGNVFDEDSNHSKCSRASTSSDSDVVIINNHVSPTSKVIKQNVEAELGCNLEAERRERPVRNRVKVEKEDFIYDFTDSFLKKEDSSKVSGSSGSNIISRKKLGDSGKESVKYEVASSHHSNLYKSVPKLTLVRTDVSEAAGNKRVTGPIKGSWNSVYGPTSDSAGNKNYLESNSQMCSSSRKLPRT